MSWSTSITAKTIGEAKERIAAETMSESKQYGIPKQVSDYIAHGVTILGEPAEGEEISIDGHGHEFSGPGSSPDVTITLNIVHIKSK